MFHLIESLFFSEHQILQRRIKDGSAGDACWQLALVALYITHKHTLQHPLHRLHIVMHVNVALYIQLPADQPVHPLCNTHTSSSCCFPHLWMKTCHCNLTFSRACLCSCEVRNRNGTQSTAILVKLSKLLSTEFLLSVKCFIMWFGRTSV